MFKKYVINDQKGVALFTVVLVFLILVTLLSGVMFSAVINQRNSILAKDHTSVYYVAESGINLEIAKMETLFNLTTTGNWSSSRLYSELVAILGTSKYTFTDNMGKASWADTVLTVSPVSYPEYPGFVFFRIISTGNIGDTSRVVSTDVGYKISLGPGRLFTFAGAVITKAGITVDKTAAQVIGPIASNLENNSTISLNNTIGCHGVTKINIPAGMNGNVSGCRLTPVALPQPIVFSDIIMPNRTLLGSRALTPNLTIDPNVGVLDLRRSNVPYGSRVFTLDRLIGRSSTNTLTIRMNGIDEREPIYVLMNFNLTSLPLNINVEGQGRLIIISQFSTDLQLNSTIRYVKDGVPTKDPSKLNLVLFAQSGTNPGIYMQPSDVFIGSVLSNSSGEVWLKGKYGGYFVTTSSNVKIQTPNAELGDVDNTIWVYAPNANFSMVANSLIYGSIMSRSFSSTNPGNELIYRDIEGIYPFEPWTPLPYAIDQNDAQAELEIKYLPTIEN